MRDVHGPGGALGAGNPNDPGNPLKFYQADS